MATIKFTAQIPQVSLKQKEKNKEGKKAILFIHMPCVPHCHRSQRPNVRKSELD